MVLQRYVQLNLIHPSGNYGWPIATLGVDYSGRSIAINSEQPGTVLPVPYWVPISIARTLLRSRRNQAAR